MTRRKKPKRAGYVQIQATTLATAAQQLGAARDRLITVLHVTGSRPDDSYSEEFKQGWQTAMKIVQSAVTGHLVAKTSPAPEPEDDPAQPLLDFEPTDKVDEA
jgi:hypothetical protein